MVLPSVHGKSTSTTGIRLAPGIAFAYVDEIGIVVDALNDRYYELDACQALLCATLLHTSDRPSAMQMLKEAIAANEVQLSQALGALEDYLLERGWIEPAHSAYGTGRADIPRFPLRAQSAGVTDAPLEPLSLVPALNVPLKQKGERLSWGIFLPDAPLSVTPHLQLSWWQRLYALTQTWRVLSLFRRKEHWMLPCYHALREIRPMPGTFHLSTTAEMLVLARQEVLWSQMVIHAIFPFGPLGKKGYENAEGLCLPRSLGLCAYLRALGVPATLVLACSRFSYHTGVQEYHAWTQVQGLPLNEAPEICSGYAPLLSLPDDKEDQMF